MVGPPATEITGMSSSIRRALGAAALFVGVGPGIALAQESPGGSVTGRVTGAPSGLAVEGAEILSAVPGARTVSDGSGRFLLESVPSGPQTLLVRAIGFAPSSVEVTVAPGERLELSVQLDRAMQVIPEMVVTAQKRAEPTLSVPITLTALDGGALADGGVRGLDALSLRVPGVVIQLQSPNNPSLAIRGITSEGQDSRLEPRVSVFQDGVSISKATGAAVELFDLERVEVLKGPQGTLFGRAAETGALHLVQNKAVDARATMLLAAFGSYTDVRLEGVGNVPLVHDRLFGRLAAVYDRHEGYVDNAAGGTLNGKETVAARASLRWLAGERTIVDLIGNLQVDDAPGVSFKSALYAPADGSIDPRTFADLDRGTELGLDRIVGGATVLVNHQASERWRITSISAFRRFDADEAFDADGTASPALFLRDIGEGSQLSQELRATFEGARVTGFTGVNLFWESGSQSTPLDVDERAYWPAFTSALNILTGGLYPVTPIVIDGQPVLVETVPPEVVAIDPALAPLVGAPFASRHQEAQTNHGRTWAVELFGDATVRLSTRFHLTAGLRGTYENVSNGLEVTNSETQGLVGYIIGTGPNDLFAPTNGRLTGGGEFTSVVGRALANYLATERLNVYAGVSRGRRPSVVNVLADRVQTLPNEVVWSYEAGAKLASASGRVRLDAAVFHYDYSNYQVERPDISTGTLIVAAQTAGPMSAWGAEASVQVAPVNALGLFASYAWLDARFDQSAGDGPAPLFPGHRPRLAPEHSFTLGARLAVTTGAAGRLLLEPAYSWRSLMFFDEGNAPLLSQDAYGLLDTRLGWQPASGAWQLTLFGRNLLDTAHLVDAGNTGAAFGLPTWIAGARRIIGIEARWRR
jgi:iron complex outermembrane receptor protein